MPRGWYQCTDDRPIRQPQGTCTAVTFWGITDKYSWLNSRTDLGCTAPETPRPLLWDDNYSKKLAYTGVMDALLGPSAVIAHGALQSRGAFGS